MCRFRTFSTRRYTLKKSCLLLAVFCLSTLSLLAQSDAWQLVSADYGWGNHRTDVTDTVRSMVRDGTLNFRVNGDSLSAQRRGKNRVLRLSVKDSNGNAKLLSYRDNQQVNLRIYDDAQGSLRIDRATYGTSYRSVDVTARLNSQIQNGRLDTIVSNQTMGGDPSPNQQKTLSIEYTRNNRREQRDVREGDRLQLSSDLNANDRYDDRNSGYNNGRMDGELQISRATYGTQYRSADVTSRLNSEIHGGRLTMQVNNETMGGDPAPRETKMLTVQYTANGRNDQTKVQEGGTLNLTSGNYELRNSFARRITCESNDNRRQYCAADTRSGVRLSRVTGNAQCVEGSTWGYDQNGVWVDRGCRAEFEMQTGRSNHGQGYGSSGKYSTTTIPSGTQISVRTNDAIDSKTASIGQTFSAQLESEIVDNNGSVRIPKGSDVELVIRNASGDPNKSSSDLVLDLAALTVNGTRYMVSTDDLVEQGSGQGVGANKRTAVMVGGGAAIGSVIGAIVGGGKGAAIGAAVGAGAGVGAEVLTKGKQVKVPSETILQFRLDQDLRLQATR